MRLPRAHSIVIRRLGRKAIASREALGRLSQLTQRAGANERAVSGHSPVDTRDRAAVHRNVLLVPSRESRSPRLMSAVIP
jgi:hypothetical protein